MLPLPAGHAAAARSAAPCHSASSAVGQRTRSPVDTHAGATARGRVPECGPVSVLRASAFPLPVARAVPSPMSWHHREPRTNCLTIRLRPSGRAACSACICPDLREIPFLSCGATRLAERATTSGRMGRRQRNLVLLNNSPSFVCRFGVEACLGERRGNAFRPPHAAAAAINTMRQPPRSASILREGSSPVGQDPASGLGERSE
jgi:hypothetical protein